MGKCFEVSGDWAVLSDFEQGLESDYYAMFQMYGGFAGVGEIVKNMPYLEPREIAFACVLLKLKKEELYCLKRKLLREK